MIRVINDTHGLMWTGTDPEHAEHIALVVAVNTARTTYLQDGEDDDRPVRNNQTEGRSS